MAAFIDPEEKVTFDITSKDREMLTAERTEELFAPIIEGKHDYQMIRLGTKSFGRDACSVGVPALQKLENLAIADMADIIAGRMEDEGLEVLQKLSDALASLSNVTQVDLSDNALGRKGIMACKNLFSKSLEKIALKNCGLSAESHQLLTELLLKNGDSTKVKMLHLHNNMSGTQGGVNLEEFLCKSPDLEDFMLSSTRCEEEGGIALSRGLAQCPHLKRIDLNDNTFGILGGRQLGKAFCNLQNLLHINIRDLGVQDEGFYHVCKGLQRGAASLEFLDASGNEITKSGARGFEFAFSNKKKLKTLLLEDNELGAEGGKRLAAAITADRLPALTELNVTCCELTSQAALQLATAVAALPACSCLRMDNNAIRHSVLKEVRAVLAESVDLGSMSDNDGSGDETEEDEDGESDEEYSDLSGDEGQAEDDSSLSSAMDSLSLNQ